MCQGGNCRSVGLAFVLKYGYGHDALACGWEKNSESTREMLFNWADRIFIVEESFKQYIPEKYEEKVTVYELGPDRWFNSLHNNLLQCCDDLIHVDEKWMDFEVPV